MIRWYFRYAIDFFLRANAINLQCCSVAIVAVAILADIVVVATVVVVVEE